MTAKRAILGAGKLLPVRIISQPLRTVSVQFVVEDARGNPVPVQLFHVPTTSIPQDQLHDWFPIGAIFGTLARRLLQLLLGVSKPAHSPDSTITQASKNRSSALSMTGPPTTSGSNPPSTSSDSTLAPHS